MTLSVNKVSLTPRLHHVKELVCHADNSVHTKLFSRWEPVPDMIYNVFGGTLNLNQSIYIGK